MSRLDNAYAFKVYKRAQQLDEWPGEDYGGSSVNAACKVLRERGFIIFCRGVSKWGSLRLFNSWGNHGRCWLSKADCLWLMKSPSFRAAAAVQIA